MMAAAAANAQTIGIATSPAGALYHSTGVALAKLLNDKMGVKARVQPYSGSSTYIPFLNRNEVQLALINVSDAVTTIKGVENFKGRPQPNIRLLTLMYPLPFTIMVAKDSDIKTLKDLKGKRLTSHFTGQTTIAKLHRAVLANAGLSYSDTKSFPVPNVVAAAEALGDRKVDAVGSTPGMAVVRKVATKLKNHGGVRFISISNAPAAVAAMQKVLPSKPMLLKPRKNLPEITEPIYVMAFYSFLATNSQMSNDEAYKVVKTMHDNKPYLVAAYGLLNRFDPKNMTVPMERDYHPGAIKFYKEIGQWPPKP